MLRMAFEREVIMNIRHRVDVYDEQQLFSTGSSLDANTPVTRSHIRLGSLDGIIHLCSYAKKLCEDLDLQNLQNRLSTFLHINHVFNAEDAMSDFEVRDP